VQPARVSGGGFVLEFFNFAGGQHHARSSTSSWSSSRCTDQDACMQSCCNADYNTVRALKIKRDAWLTYSLSLHKPAPGFTLHGSAVLCHMNV
jgi:hypothetical protein